MFKIGRWLISLFHRPKNTDKTDVIKVESTENSEKDVPVEKAAEIHSLSTFVSQSSYFKVSRNSLISVISDTGARGEFQLCNELDKLPVYNRILVNMYLPNAYGGSCEVDAICFTGKGIFIIEYKNYSGNIYGYGKNKYWKYYSDAHRVDKPILFFNPILQNESHIRALKLHFSYLPSGFIHSLIVFSNRCLLNVSSPSVPVIHRKDLLVTILQIMERSEIYLSDREIDNLYKVFYDFYEKTEHLKQSHIDYIKSFNK